MSTCTYGSARRCRLLRWRPRVQDKHRSARISCRQPVSHLLHRLCGRRGSMGPGPCQRRLRAVAKHCAAGQASLPEAASVLYHGEDGGLTFYIFGTPVTLSPSPCIHAAGFRANGFPHQYTYCDSDDPAHVIQQCRAPGSGGGSVTIPLKESVIPHLDNLSDTARKIGAVNTITKLGDGSLFGDNTDWKGIQTGLEARRSADAASVGLICGAGGTARAACYALQQMNVGRVIILNPRTPSRASVVAADFRSSSVEVKGVGSEIELVSAVMAAGRLDFVINTLPGTTNYVLPDEMVPLLLRWRPIALEAAYIPRQTAFVLQALECGCEVVEGVEMLFEQGCAQCEIWTGRAAPRRAIASDLLATLFTEGSEHPARVEMTPLDAPPSSLASNALQ